MKDRRYRGKRGLSAEQTIAVAAVVIAVILAMTIHVNSAWTGMSAGEQVQQALFAAEDWD